jgi:hypothetical protein
MLLLLKSFTPTYQEQQASYTAAMLQNIPLCSLKVAGPNVTALVKLPIEHAIRSKIHKPYNAILTKVSIPWWYAGPNLFFAR